jgi:hypothetical protein
MNWRELMSPQRDWEKVLPLQPKGYAELRNHDNSMMYHGPVKELRVDREEDMVEIHFHWLATVPLGPIGIPTGEWEVAPPAANPVRFPNLVLPYEVEGTEKGPRIRFGLNIMYVKEVQGLPPERVRGLVLPIVSTEEVPTTE